VRAAGENDPPDQAAQMVTAFALALQGFERGEIAMGARKRRGFGACRVASWQVQRYDLREPAGLLAWLSDGRHGEPTAAGAGTAIAQLLGVDPGRTDQREYCTLTATFRLDSSLLIRAGGDEPNQPDMVHLTSKRSGQPVPIVSGTSMGGALRARALRIVNTIGSRRKAGEFVADLFGPKMEGANATPRASRVWVEECAIEAPPDPLIVQRVAIDRFTGGTLPGALFAQQPVFAGEDTRVKLAVTVQAAPADRPGAHSFKADLGLLLLVLKDLWTGDLPIGGEASVGRGRLVGETATLILHRAGADPGPTWMITQGAAGLAVQGDLDEMQACVDTLVKEVQA
jgi:CRISPR/Cas system CSM-associated protein Csm3 (group 7 of RAMP superfamily)